MRAVFEIVVVSHRIVWLERLHKTTQHHITWMPESQYELRVGKDRLDQSYVGHVQRIFIKSNFLHQEVELISKEMLSKLRDVDYAEAVSTLTYQVTVLEAAQKSFAMISRLSLFNVL